MTQIRYTLSSWGLIGAAVCFWSSWALMPGGWGNGRDANLVVSRRNPNVCLRLQSCN
jgi:hypothetical protein